VWVFGGLGIAGVGFGCSAGWARRSSADGGRKTRTLIDSAHRPKLVSTETSFLNFSQIMKGLA
jgi:hypothetical protein